MSTQRRQRRVANARLSKVYYVKFLAWALLAVAFVLAGFGIYYFSSKDVRNRKEKIFFVVPSEQEVIVAVIDPVVSEITFIKIPGATEVEVAHQLGKWKIGSVAKLAEQEKIKELLPRTVAKNFKFPLYQWADGGALKLLDQNPIIALGSVFIPHKSNLSIKDKLEMALFSASIFSDTKRLEIDLENSQVIKKTHLIDGSDGFVLTGTPSQRILSIFSDPIASDKVYTIAIKDHSQDYPFLGEEVGGIIEALGSKVVSITKETPEDFDCKVSGKNGRLVSKVVLIFSCEKEGGYVGNFDVEVKIGKAFLEKF